MTTAVNLIIAATVLASIYGLINVGFVLLSRTTGVINFAQGHFMLLGAFLMWALTQVLPYVLSLIITILLIGLLGSITTSTAPTSAFLNKTFCQLRPPSRDRKTPRSALGA